MLNIVLFLALAIAVRTYRKPFLWAALFALIVAVYSLVTSEASVWLILGVALFQFVLAAFCAYILDKLLQIYHLRGSAFWFLALTAAVLIGLL